MVFVQQRGLCIWMFVRLRVHVGAWVSCTADVAGVACPQQKGLCIWMFVRLRVHLVVLCVLAAAGPVSSLLIC